MVEICEMESDEEVGNKCETGSEGEMVEISEVEVVNIFEEGKAKGRWRKYVRWKSEIEGVEMCEIEK